MKNKMNYCKTGNHTLVLPHVAAYHYFVVVIHIQQTDNIIPLHKICEYHSIKRPASRNTNFDFSDVNDDADYPGLLETGDEDNNENFDRKPAAVTTTTRSNTSHQPIANTEVPHTLYSKQRPNDQQFEQIMAERGRDTFVNFEDIKSAFEH